MNYVESTKSYVNTYITINIDILCLTTNQNKKV